MPRLCHTKHYVYTAIFLCMILSLYALAKKLSLLSILPIKKVSHRVHYLTQDIQFLHTDPEFENRTICL